MNYKNRIQPVQFCLTLKRFILRLLFFVWRDERCVRCHVQVSTDAFQARVTQDIPESELVLRSFRCGMHIQHSSFGYVNNEGFREARKKEEKSSSLRREIRDSSSEVMQCKERSLHRYFERYEDGSFHGFFPQSKKAQIFAQPQNFQFVSICVNCLTAGSL